MLTENDHSKDMLHGIKLQDIVTFLVDYYGWEELGSMIKINCFNLDPSVKSSLKFLRRTAWARNKVEKLYIETRGKTL
ncbi:MAG: VF530 family protein [Spirochaetaceae bacterium]